MAELARALEEFGPPAAHASVERIVRLLGPTTSSITPVAEAPRDGEEQAVSATLPSWEGETVPAVTSPPLFPRRVRYALAGAILLGAVTGLFLFREAKQAELENAALPASPSHAAESFAPSPTTAALPVATAAADSTRKQTPPPFRPRARSRSRPRSPSRPRGASKKRAATSRNPLRPPRKSIPTMAPRTANRTRHRLGACLLASALACPATALAQVSDVARAEQLFNEGRALMKQGEYSRACARFAESQALDPGGGTILNLGICRRHEGRTATAHAILSEALEQARADKRADRMATAQKHLDALAAVLSRVTVRVPEDPPQGLTVEIDGEALSGPPESWTFPLDPGVHEVRASADGHTPWSVRVTLSPAADHVVVELPPLKPIEQVETAKAPVPAPAIVQAPPSPPARPAPPVAGAAKPRSSQPFANAPAWLGYALTGGGAAAIGAGAYFGVRALGLKSSSDEQYDFEKKRCRTQACVDDWNDAKTAALGSNVLLGLGALGLAGGAYFLFRPQHEPEAGDVRVTLRASPDGAGASAAGSF